MTKVKNASRDIFPGLARVLANISPILMLFVFGKIASTEELGRLNYFISLVIIANGFTNFGIPEAVQRFVPQDDDKTKYIFQTIVLEFAITFIAGLVVLLVDILSGGFISKGYEVEIFLIIVFSAANTLILSFNGLMDKFKVGLYFFGIAATFVFSGYYMYEVLGKSPTESYIWAQLIAWAIFTVIPLADLYYHGYIKVRITAPKRYMQFAVANAIITFTLVVFTEWDSIVVHTLGGEYLNGVYKSIDYLALAPNIIGTVLTTQLLPMYSGLFAQGEYKKIKESYQKLTNLFLLLLPVTVITIFFVSRPLIEMIFTKEIADEGWFMLPLVIIGSMMYVVVVPCVSVLQAVGKENFVRNVTLLITVIFMVCSTAFFPIIGIYGMILLGIILSVGFWIVMYGYTQRFINSEISS